MTFKKMSVASRHLGFKVVLCCVGLCCVVLCCVVLCCAVLCCVVLCCVVLCCAVLCCAVLCCVVLCCVVLCCVVLRCGRVPSFQRSMLPPSYHNTTRRHNPEDDLNHHGSLRTLRMAVVYSVNQVKLITVACALWTSCRVVEYSGRRYI
jgi:hypothetical protein